MPDSSARAEACFHLELVPEPELEPAAVSLASIELASTAVASTADHRSSAYYAECWPPGLVGAARVVATLPDAAAAEVVAIEVD